MINVVLIEDHHLVRQGIVYMLDQEQSIHIIGEADTGDLGVQLVRKVSPDLVVLDVHLPDISGIEVVRRIKQINKNVKILILTATHNLMIAKRLLSMGVQGYLTKDTLGVGLVDTIIRIQKGEVVICNDLSERIIFSNEAVCNAHIKKFDKLSLREFELMLMTIRGDSVSSISAKLFLSQDTVVNYRGKMLKKMGLKNAVELALLAASTGLVDFREEK